MPAGAGYDQVDVAACTARGIRVANVPALVDDATADANMFLILGALRGFNVSMQALRAGQWRGSPVPPLGHDPEGKVLGILGMGGIGRNLKKKADAFGMKVIYHNRRKLSEELAGGAEYVSFDELLSASDVVSLNLPLNVSGVFLCVFHLSSREYVVESRIIVVWESIIRAPKRPLCQETRKPNTQGLRDQQCQAEARDNQHACSRYLHGLRTGLSQSDWKRCRLSHRSISQPRRRNEAFPEDDFRGKEGILEAGPNSRVSHRY